MKRVHILAGLVVSVCLCLVVGTVFAEVPYDVKARNGVVVSVSGEASDVGMAVLARGGNAVDAAVATAFALAVTYPAAGNIGGGGFMMVHMAKTGETVCVE